MAGKHKPDRGGPGLGDGRPGKDLLGLAVGAAGLTVFLLALVAGRALGFHLGIDRGLGFLLVAAGAGALVVLVAIVHRPWTGVALVFLTFPIGSIVLPAGSLDVKVVEAAVLLVAGLLALRRLASGSLPLPLPSPMWPALLVLVAALLATPGALDVGEAARFDTLLVIVLLMALLVPAACRSLDEARRPLAVLMAVGAGISGYAFHAVSGLQAFLGGAVVQNRAISVFSQPNDFGAFAASLFLVAIGMALGSRSRPARRVCALVAALAFGGLVLSLSRGSWLGAVAGLALLLALAPSARPALFRVGLPIVAAGALVFAVFLPSGPTDVQVVQQRLTTLAAPFHNPYDARPQIWREAVHEIEANPWTGVGPGNFLVASSRAGSFVQAAGAEHAHNTVLNVAAEEGIPAAGLLIAFGLVMGAIILRAAKRLPDTRDRALVAGVGAALFAQVGQGLVDFPLRDPVVAVLMASLVGVVLVAQRQLTQSGGVRP